MTGPTLGEAFAKLQAALDPFAIEIGREVLDVWRDRAKFGREPLPAGALRRLAAVIDQLLLDQAAAQARSTVGSSEQANDSSEVPIVHLPAR